LADFLAIPTALEMTSIFFVVLPLCDGCADLIYSFKCLVAIGLVDLGYEFPNFNNIALCESVFKLL